MTLRPIAALALIATIALAGCGGSSKATTRKAVTMPAASGTAWNQVLNNVGLSGAVNQDTALQAFALAFGGMPGVTTPTGPTGTGVDASEALRWTLQYAQQLAPEQRVALDKVLVGQQVGSPGKARRVDGPNTARYRSIVDATIAKYVPLVGPLTLAVDINLVAQYPNSYAYVYARNAQHGYSGTASECFVGVTPLGEKASDSQLAAYLGHEIFHCYQAQWVNALSNWYNTTASPSWVVEGSATWAGLNYANVSIAAEDNWWGNYLITPEAPLFKRTYDAVGFFGQAEWSGVDVWKVFKPFMQTAGNEARYQVFATAGGEVFLNTWASGLYRRKNLGTPWVVVGKFVPSREEVPTPMTDLAIANGKIEVVKAAAYTNALYWIDSSADILHVSLTGHGRIADSYGFDSTQISDAFFCTKDGGSCPCPTTEGQDGTQGALPVARPALKGGISLGVTGADTGANGSLEGMTLNDFCARTKKKTGPCRLLDQAVVKQATGLDTKPGVESRVADGTICTWSTDQVVNSPFAGLPNNGGGILPGPTTKASVSLLVRDPDTGGEDTAELGQASEVTPTPLAVSDASQALTVSGNPGGSQTTAIVVTLPKGQPKVIVMFVFGATPGVPGATLLAQTAVNRF